MAMVIVGLLKDAHQARGLIRALDDAGFSGDDIDMQGGLVADLTLRGVPAEDAQAYAEGVRRGGAIVCVRADARTRGRYAGPERRQRNEPYAGDERRSL